MKKTDEKADYTIGYGKPPIQRRFKMGQSGNPKGRPRKIVKESELPRFCDNHLNGLLEREVFRLLHLNENGNPVEMSAAQAIMRSFLVEGIKGNRLAKKDALGFLRREEQEALKRACDHYKYFAQKKAEGDATIARHKKQGIPPPRLFPHPDDILLDEAEMKAYILGPLSEDQAIPFARWALFRDLLHVRSVLNEKYGEVKTMECGSLSASSLDVMAAIIEKSLPPSFRRDNSSTLMCMMDLHRQTKKQLRQRIQGLKVEIANMPTSIKEQLADRAGAADVRGAIGEKLAKAADELLKKTIRDRAKDGTFGENRPPEEDWTLGGNGAK
ncbi:MAG: hypothetical protein FJ246_11695 [Nitrospira sp.]|nr:hypothetical protein [Nitrospira sp.]